MLNNNELYHHGILGQKWGVRRYQNKDGSLTEAGKKHLGINDEGNIALISGKTSKEAKTKFATKAAIKTGLTIGSMALSSYITKNPQFIVGALTGFLSTHPEIIESGMSIVQKILSSDQMMQSSISAAKFIADNPEAIKAGSQIVNEIISNEELMNAAVREIENNPELINVGLNYLNGK